MFHKKNTLSFALIAFVVLGFGLSQVSANEAQDQLDVKTRVLELQDTDNNLPGGVTEQKGRVGALLATLFDSDGKIKKTFLERIFSGVADGSILRYDSGSSGFVSTLVGLADLAANSVNSSKVLNNSLTASDLAVNSVGDSELIDTPQVVTLGVRPGNGRGVKFWNSDSYKIHMGNSSEYRYGPVTGYSIKNNMNTTAGRGWTWGIAGQQPVVAFNNQGNAQFAGTVTAATPTAGGHLTTKDYVDTEVTTAGGWEKTGIDIYRDGGKVGIGTSGPITEDFEVHGDAMLLKNNSAQLFFDQTLQSGVNDTDFLIEDFGDGLFFFEGIYDPNQTTTDPKKMVHSAMNGYNTPGAWPIMRMHNNKIAINHENWMSGMPINALYVKKNVNTPIALHVEGNASKSEGGASWLVSSDARLKDVHGSYNYGLDEITALETVRFNYKEDNSKGLSSEGEQIGFIAQDVQKIIPEAISTGSDGYLEFNMHPINVALVNAIKELSEKNDALEKDIQELKELMK